MENPNTHTWAVNVIEAAIREWNIDQKNEVIGLSLPSYIEDYLVTYGFLNHYGLEVVGVMEIPRKLQ